MVSHIFHLSIHRIPIGMNVERRHEDREHYGIRFKVFRFIYFLNRHYLTVDRAYHHIAARPLIMTLGAAKKIEHENVDHRRYGGEYGREHDRGHKKPHRHVECGEYDKEENEDICAFVVNLHVLNIFQCPEISEPRIKLTVIDKSLIHGFFASRL